MIVNNSSMQLSAAVIDHFALQSFLAISFHSRPPPSLSGKLSHRA